MPTQSNSRNQKRRKKGQNQKPSHTTVTEASRIQIRQLLEKFRASNDEEYTFEASLSNTERKEVHALSRKMGMTSKSSGAKCGPDRRVTVYKNLNKIKKNEVITESRNELPSFSFSEKGNVVLNDYFSQYPPGSDCNSETITSTSSTNIDNVQRKDDIFGKPVMTNADIKRKHNSMVARFKNEPKLKQIAQDRAKLPIASFKDVITSAVASNQVVLISGETGCGKTTQVPQYLLDYMWEKGEACKIVCTQPRRISAVSVAERIAQERGEIIGDSVGYKIRLESQGGRQSSIVFCTNGVLLRVLVAAGKHRSAKAVEDGFPDITHIIVDEIHERDKFSDFMLAIIRDMLPLYPNLRVVLMSATLDAERFSQYFGGCPIIRVPGFTYNVQKFYLEDVLMLVRSHKVQYLDSTTKTKENENQLPEYSKIALEEAINLAMSNDDMDSLADFITRIQELNVINFQHSTTGVTPLMVFAKRGRIQDMCLLISLGADVTIQDKQGKTALNYAENENQIEAIEILKKHIDLKDPKEEQSLLNNYMENVNPEYIDVILLEQLLRKICTESEEGAILVFLPGWDDINKSRDNLSNSELFRNESKFLILALHSMVPPIEQKRVFQRPPKGCRKIVLSTNIAETAVTIDDVVFVIDSGRMKEKSYDPYNKVSTLQSSWISKASAKQREGRAGRCRPGICYHLYSKLRAASLPEYQVPEIKRTPIEELCLQVKLLDPTCKIEDFLKKTLDPPVLEATHNAIVLLQEIGALSPTEDLTELGSKLGSIPVHPLTSKMLLFAISVNCLDPALTLACASGYKDPFTLPLLPNLRKRADAAKAELAALYGGYSDQLAIIAAYECWKNANRTDRNNLGFKFYVSGSVMYMLNGMRMQLLNELFRNGFIPGKGNGLSENSRDIGILHAVLVAGLYPMVGILQKNSHRFEIETASNSKVRLHPQSVNSKFKFNDDCVNPLVVFDEIMRGDGGLSIKSCSIVGPLPILLFANEIAVAPRDDDDDDDDGSDDDDDDDDDGDKEMKCEDDIMLDPDNVVKVVADRWLSIKSTALTVAQIYCLRERLAAAIKFKITHPGKDLPQFLAVSIHTITKILSYDGLNGIQSPVEPVVSLSKRVREASIQEYNEKVDCPNKFLTRLFFDPPQHNLPNQHDFMSPQGVCRSRKNTTKPTNSTKTVRTPAGSSRSGTPHLF